MLENLSTSKLLGLLDITLISISKQFEPNLTKEQEKTICHSVRCTFLEVLTSETKQDPSTVFRAIRELVDGGE